MWRRSISIPQKQLKMSYKQQPGMSVKETSGGMSGKETSGGMSVKENADFVKKGKLIVCLTEYSLLRMDEWII